MIEGLKCDELSYSCAGAGKQTEVHVTEKVKSTREVAREVALKFFSDPDDYYHKRLADAIDEALRQRDEQAAKSVEEFDEWVLCGCSECKVDARGHAVDVHASLNNIAAAIRNEERKG